MEVEHREITVHFSQQDRQEIVSALRKLYTCENGVSGTVDDFTDNENETMNNLWSLLGP